MIVFLFEQLELELFLDSRDCICVRALSKRLFLVAFGLCVRFWKLPILDYLGFFISVPACFRISANSMISKSSVEFAVWSKLLVASQPKSGFFWRLAIDLALVTSTMFFNLIGTVALASNEDCAELLFFSLSSDSSVSYLFCLSCLASFFNFIICFSMSDLKFCRTELWLVLTPCGGVAGRAKPDGFFIGSALWFSLFMISSSFASFGSFFWNGCFCFLGIFLIDRLLNPADGNKLYPSNGTPLFSS